MSSLPVEFLLRKLCRPLLTVTILVLFSLLTFIRGAGHDCRINFKVMIFEEIVVRCGEKIKKVATRLGSLKG
jgi:hypothetical protein